MSDISQAEERIQEALGGGAPIEEIYIVRVDRQGIPLLCVDMTRAIGSTLEAVVGHYLSALYARMRERKKWRKINAERDKRNAELEMEVERKRIRRSAREALNKNSNFETAFLMDSGPMRYGNMVQPKKAKWPKRPWSLREEYLQITKGIRFAEVEIDPAENPIGGAQ